MYLDQLHVSGEFEAKRFRMIYFGKRPEELFDLKTENKTMQEKWRRVINQATADYKEKKSKQYKQKLSKYLYLDPIKGMHRKPSGGMYS